MTDLSELLRNVRRLEIRTRRMVDSLAAGQYRSRFKGQGMEFEEVREYAEGDDIRHIDWNVTARAGRAYIKTFREERDLSVMVLVDVSGSMRFGVSGRSKLTAAAEAAAVLGVTALRNNDLIGLVTFSDEHLCHIPARKGRRHCMRVIREVLGSTAQARPTDITHALEEFIRTSTKRTVCFIISDFIEPEPRLGSVLARAARRHDIIGLRVSDPAEADLPASGPLVLSDPEGRGQRVLASSPRIRQRYRETYQAQRSQVEKLFVNANCDMIDFNCDESAFAAIQRFFARSRRGARRG